MEGTHFASGHFHLLLTAFIFLISQQRPTFSCTLSKESLQNVTQTNRQQNMCSQPASNISFFTSCHDAPYETSVVAVINRFWLDHQLMHTDIWMNCWSLTNTKHITGTICTITCQISPVQPSTRRALPPSSVNVMIFTKFQPNLLQFTPLI